MVVTLNSALTSNSRGTYNPSMINFGKNELKNTTYLKEAPRTEVKHASKFARTAAKFMLGAMGFLSMAACSGSDDIPDVPTQTPKLTVLQRFTKISNAIGMTHASANENFESAVLQDADGQDIMSVNHLLTTDDTLYIDHELNAGTIEQTKYYKNQTNDNLHGINTSKDSKTLETFYTEPFDYSLNDKVAKPIVTAISETEDLITEQTKGAAENTIDFKSMTKSRKLIEETTEKVLKSTTRAIR